MMNPGLVGNAMLSGEGVALVVVVVDLDELHLAAVLLP